MLIVLRAPGIISARQSKSKFSLHDNRKQFVSQFSSFVNMNEVAAIQFESRKRRGNHLICPLKG